MRRRVINYLIILCIFLASSLAVNAIQFVEQAPIFVPEPTIVNYTLSADPGYVFETEGNLKYKAYFNTNPSAGSVLKYVKDGISLTLEPLGLVYLDTKGKTEDIATPKPIIGKDEKVKDSSGKLSAKDKDSFNYKDAFGTGISLRYILNKGELKEEVIIKELASLPVLDEKKYNGKVNLGLDFTLTTTGRIFINNIEWDKTKEVSTADDVVIKNNDGNQVYSLAKPYLIDANGIKYPMSYVFKSTGKKGSALYVSITTEYDIIKNAAFPITIDPTITVDGGSPHALAYADINRDGNMDIVTVSFDSYAVYWYKNNGSSIPGWTPYLISDTISNPQSVYTADMDNDGRTDVIVGDYGGGVTWLRNNGSLEFWSAYQLNSVGYITSTVHAADIDRDGRLDVIFPSYIRNSTYWLKNDGSLLGWNQYMISNTSLYARAAYTADIDMDGRIDVVTASVLDDKISWYKNNGSLSSWPGYNISITADGAESVSVSDVDRDGRIDVISVSSNDLKVAWYKNNGSLSYWPQYNISNTASGTWRVDIGDINNDGRDDVVSAGNGLMLLMNNGSLSYWPYYNLTNMSDYIYSTKIVDIDKDGDKDIIAILADGQVNYYRNEEAGVSSPDLKEVSISNPGNNQITVTGKWAAGNKLTKFAITNNSAWFDCNYTVFTGCYNISAAINGSVSNGEATLTYTVTQNHTWYARVYDQDGNWDSNGTMVGANTYNISTTANGANSVFAADIDRDGDMDILSASFIDDKIAWYKNNGSLSNWSVYILSTAADSARFVYSVDIDRDGDMDVLSASYDDDKIAWYENNGSLSNWPAYNISTIANGANSVYSVDIDRDGDMDVLSASYNDNKVAWYNNNGSLSNWPVYNLSTVALGTNSVYSVDIDRDGDMDVLSASSSDNKIAWYNNNGSLSNWPRYTISTLVSYANSVYSVDIDRDGDMDVLSASSEDDKIAWYKNNGSLAYWPVYNISITANDVRFVYSVDIDRDGDMDVLSASYDDNKIAWYENNGSLSNWPAYNISTASGAISVYAVDIDRDGDMDVLSASLNDDKIAWYETLDNALFSGNLTYNYNPGIIFDDRYTLTNDSVFYGKNYNIYVNITDDTTSTKIVRLNWNGTIYPVAYGYLLESFSLSTTQFLLNPGRYYYQVNVTDTTYGLSNATEVRWLTVVGISNVSAVYPLNNSLVGSIVNFMCNASSQLYIKNITNSIGPYTNRTLLGENYVLSLMKSNLTRNTSLYFPSGLFYNGSMFFSAEAMTGATSYLTTYFHNGSMKDNVNVKSSAGTVLRTYGIYFNGSIYFIATYPSNLASSTTGIALVNINGTAQPPIFSNTEIYINTTAIERYPQAIWANKSYIWLAGPKYIWRYLQNGSFDETWNLTHTGSGAISDIYYNGTYFYILAVNNSFSNAYQISYNQSQIYRYLENGSTDGWYINTTLLHAAGMASYNNTFYLIDSTPKTAGGFNLPSLFKLSNVPSLGQDAYYTQGVTYYSYSSGVSSYRCSAYDSYGDYMSSSNYTFEVDATAPVLAFTSPTLDSGEYISINSYFINYTFSDAHNQTTKLYWINGSYQEDANQTTLSGNAVDGDWDTNNQISQDNISYIKPAGAIGAIWQLKLGYNVPPVNSEYYYITIPDDVFGASDNLNLSFYGCDSESYQLLGWNGSASGMYGTEQQSISGCITGSDYLWEEAIIWIYNTTEYATDCSSWYCTLNITEINDATYYYYAWMNDSVSNEGVTDVRSITIDTTKPYVDFWAPTQLNATTIIIDSYYINVTYIEANRLNTYLDWNGENLSMTCGTGGCYYNVTGLVGGSYYYKVYMDDQAGNSNVTVRRWITYSSTPPALEYITPTQNNATFFGSRYYYINVSYTEANRATTFLNWNNSNLTMTCNTGACNYTVNASDGYYWYNVFMNNTFGSSTLLGNRYITIDTIKPVLDFVTPTLENNSFTASSSYYVNLSYTEVNRATTLLDWNGVNESMTCTVGGCYVNKEGLLGGSYYYTVFMNDSAGNSNLTIRRWVNVDLTPPSVNILRPEAKTYLTNTSLPLNYTATDASLSTVWYNLDGGDNFTLTENITFNTTTGDHILYLFANDSANNVGIDSVAFTVNVDLAAPVTVLNFPSNGTRLNYNNVTLNSTSTDPTLGTCKLYGDFSSEYILNQTLTVPNNDTVQSWSAIYLNEGTYHWNVWCNDTSSNNATATFNYTFYIDTTFPIIDFYSPTQANGTYRTVNSYFVNISFIESNRATTLLDWNGVNQTMTCGTGGCYVNKTGLLEGAYYYKIYMNDTAGNSNVTNRRWVTIDTLLPTITFVSPTVANNGYTTSSYWYINYTYTETNLAQSWLNLGGTNYNVTCNEYYCERNMTAVEGTYTYYIYMNDSAGNQMTPVSRTVTLDNTDPYLNYSSSVLANASYLNSGSYTVTVDYIEPSRRNTYLDWNGGGNVSMDCGASSCSYTKSGLTNGVYYYKVYMDDYVNKTNVTQRRWITIDSTAPSIDYSAPTLSSGQFIIVNSYYVNISFVELNRATTLLNWNGVNETMTCGTGGCYVNKTNLADATYSYKVWMNDSVGLSAVTSLRYITVDLMSPLFANNSHSPAHVYINSTVALNITVIEDTPSRVWLETNISDTWANYTLLNISKNYYMYFNPGNLTNHENITYRFHANDSAGNVNSSDWYTTLVENRAPSILSNTLNATGINVNSIMLNFTGVDAENDNITIYVYLNNGSQIGATNDSYFNMTGLPENAITYWYYFGGDLYDNSSKSDNHTLYVDTVNPSAVITAPINTTSYGLSTSLTYRVNDTLLYKSCWYNIVEASTGDYIKENTSVVCTTSATSVSFVLTEYSSYLLQFYVNDTANNVNYTRIAFTTSAGYGAGGGGGASPKVTIINNTVFVGGNVSQQFCNNDGTCQAGIEDTFSCPKDCPMSANNILLVLRSAWFAKFAFIFVIFGFMLMVYKEQANKKGNKGKTNPVRYT